MAPLVSMRPAKRDVHGVLLLDKPAGLSSNQALVRAKQLFHAKKAGHTGTLDPFATGLLPICFGEATKFSQDLLEADKTYEAVVHLGIRTTTGDTEGERIDGPKPVSFSSGEIETVLSRFRGTILQIPPMYSALKRDGKPFYDYARAGIELEREARPVTIHRLALVEFSSPFLTLAVTCSKGTYIRVLGEDIGCALGCGAHLKALRRIGVGTLGLDSAVSLDDLEERMKLSDDPVVCAQLKPVDYLLSSFPAVTLEASLTKRFLNGQRLASVKERIDLPVSSGRCRVYAAENGLFLGTASVCADGVVAPERLVSLSSLPRH